MRRPVSTFVLGVAAAVAATGCAGGQDGSADAVAPSPKTTATSTIGPGAAGEGPSRSYAGATRATAGERGWTLLEIPDIGALSVRCPESGVRTLSFSASPDGATVAIVVERRTETVGQTIDPGQELRVEAGTTAPEHQTWQVAWVGPETAVAVIDVAVIPAPPALGGQGCFASARADLTRSP